MSRKYHYLKTETEYFQAVEKGKKKFELRKNDRNFEVYDMVILEETIEGIKTGRQLRPLEIMYILKGGKYGLDDGFCIINWQLFFWLRSSWGFLKGVYALQVDKRQKKKFNKRYRKRRMSALINYNELYNKFKRKI